MSVAGREAGGGHVAVDGEGMGGKDVGVGFSSVGSQCAVSKNGRRESSGGDQEAVVYRKCLFPLSQYSVLTSISRSQIGNG